MPATWEILACSLLPLVVSVAILAAGLWLSRDTKNTWAGSVAIGGAFSAAYFALVRPMPFPPQDAIHWLGFAAIPITVLGLIETLVRPPWLARAMVALGATVGLVWLLLLPLTRSEWQFGQSVVWIGGVSAVLFLAWWSLDRLSRRVSAVSQALMLGCCALFSAILLTMTGSLLALGLPAGALTAAVAPVILIGWRWPRLEISRGTPFVFTLLWLGLLINGRFWSNLTAAETVLLVLAPHLAWVGEFGVLKRKSFWRLAAVLVPLLIAGAVAGMQMYRETGADGSSGM
jgi:hypothetical protein